MSYLFFHADGHDYAIGYGAMGPPAHGGIPVRVPSYEAANVAAHAFFDKDLRRQVVNIDPFQLAPALTHADHDRAARGIVEELRMGRTGRFVMWRIERRRPALDHRPSVVDLMDLLPPDAVVERVKPRSTRPLACVCIEGIPFDLERAFVLPTMIASLRKLPALIAECAPANILVVGHTDAHGSTAYNLELSLDRARTVVAYLEGNVDAWLAFYHHARRSRRFGPREDRAMLGAIRDSAGAPYIEPRTSLDHATRAFQSNHGLAIDGVLGPKTRRALVGEYMRLLGTKLTSGVRMVAHGCGEHFPRDAAGHAPYARENRRVEMFLFPTAIDPPPPAPAAVATARAYAAWQDAVRRRIDLNTEDAASPREIVFHDRTGRPLSDTWYCLEFADGKQLIDRADARGIGYVEITDERIDRVDLLWGADDPGGPFSFARTIYVAWEGASEDETIARKVHNLGHDTLADLQEGVLSFQRVKKIDDEPVPIGLSDGRSLPAATQARVQALFDGALAHEEET